MEAKKGLIVRSKAGRDKGGIFVILNLEDEYAYIADGNLRKVDRPKKKKLRHLQLSGFEIKLDLTAEISDRKVREALAEYSEN